MHLEKRVLVSGGAGFLGSHLCEQLLAKGQHVLCVDDFLPARGAILEHLLDHKRFELLRHDVTHPLFVEVDEIFNLACPASPIHYKKDPVQTTKTSVIGAIHMLGLAKRLKIKVLQTSTSEVYGDPSVHPQPESYWGNVNPIGPRSCYDEGKRCAETLFFDYWRQHRLPIKVVRVFNTYGPRTHPNDGRVVSSFIVQALLNRDITVFGDGSQTRSFCYVDDLIEGLMRMMDSPQDVTQGTNQPRQPGGIQHPRDRAQGHRAHRLTLQDRSPRLAARRPETATPRHRRGGAEPLIGAPAFLWPKGCRRRSRTSR